MNDEDLYLEHVGVDHAHAKPGHPGSGRYHFGSGDNPYQRNAELLKSVHEMRKAGYSDAEIAKAKGYASSSELRNAVSIATNTNRKEDMAKYQNLRKSIDPDTGKLYSRTKAASMMGVSESTARGWEKGSTQAKATETDRTVGILKGELAKGGYLDVGAGTEHQLGISRTRLKTAISEMEKEGYEVHYIQVEQMGTGKKTTVMTLTNPGTQSRDIYQNIDKIRNVELREAGEESKASSTLGLIKPTAVSSERIYVRYSEDGGIQKDGVIELRRGVPDLSLGNSKYAQVRVNVDDQHYLKGMAVYSDDIPEGYDILVNSNKAKGTPISKVFKPLKRDKNGDVIWENPFGASIKPMEKGGQSYYTDPKTGEQKLSAINKVNEEGDWGMWSKTLASQMLSKQPVSLAKRQLSLALGEQRQEYESIISLTNDAVKARLLQAFADDCDSSAVHLKAAAMPRQASHVILPITSLKDNEIYAPNYEQGERVVLIRYPHGGKFEIPELIVNNKNAEANAVMHNAIDAVGINSKVAERLSGADFDGDTVLVIPNNHGEIKTSPALAGLKDFVTDSYKFTDEQFIAEGKQILSKKPSKKDSDSVRELKEKIASGYSPTEDDYIAAGESKLVISNTLKQNEMGRVTNLINDMTLKGADPDELARAVRHSMVIIDAEKHKLDYKKSEKDNSIRELKQKYQDGGGASTLISRAKSEVRVDDRKEKYKIDPDTGEKIWTYTGATYQKNGKDIPKTIKSTQMYEAKDAFELSSGRPMETVYASYANAQKSLANNARKELAKCKPIKYSPTARDLYSAEVTSLKSKLMLAQKNAPYERQAQLQANSTVRALKNDNPGATYEEVKKWRSQALTSARTRVGANKRKIDITPKEWEAIQAGAVSNNVLNQILANTDLDIIKQYATPRAEPRKLSTAKESRIKSMLAAGYSTAEIASAVGVSTSTVSKIANE